MMARVTGLEPAASGVTGRRSNQLSYTRARERALYANQPNDASAVDAETARKTQDGRRKSEKKAPKMVEAPRVRLGASWMVGTTGIEPVTPTMST